jgi:hypothetical protein
MKKTVKPILGVAVALAMTAAGAFAQIVQTPITSLPALLTNPGVYYLTPEAAQAGVTGPVDPRVPEYYNLRSYAIVINGSGITLDLRDLTVNCVYGIAIVNGDPSDSNVTVQSTPNQAAMINSQPASGNAIGLFIMGSVSNNTVSGVTFTGTSGFNLDNGSNDTIKFCAFQGLFSVGGDHETFMKNTVTGPVGSTVFQSDGQTNSFKLNTVASGLVQLSGTDTHQNNIVTLGVASIIGGKQQGSTP